MSAETYRASQAILRMPADAVTIIVRVLYNLENAYGQCGDHERAALMSKLREATSRNPSSR